MKRCSFWLNQQLSLVRCGPSVKTGTLASLDVLVCFLLRGCMCHSSLARISCAVRVVVMHLWFTCCVVLAAQPRDIAVWHLAAIGARRGGLLWWFFETMQRGCCGEQPPRFSDVAIRRSSSYFGQHFRRGRNSSLSKLIGSINLFAACFYAVCF